MKIEAQTAWNLLEKSDNILLLTHRLPDGDAVGSLTALYYVLQSLGKNVTFLLDRVPASLQCFVPVGNKLAFEPENIITLDVGDRKLLPEDQNRLYGDKVFLNIDHHGTNVLFAQNTLVDADASAACEVLFDVLSLARFPISKQIANRLYVGIATDTGCFRYANTTAKTLRVAAELMDLGADTSKINTDIFETKTRAQVRFETAAMNSIQLYCEGRVAVMTITQQMYTDTGMDESEDKSINGLARQIEGVLVGITLKEKKDGTGWRVSVRSKEPVSAAEICTRLGGGGHRLAAGCEFDFDIKNVMKELLSSVNITLNSLKD